jgi:hypothetical protein
MAKWGLKITNPEKTFKEIDDNGGGILLFDEFSEFCIESSLDLDDDKDEEDYNDADELLEKDLAKPKKAPKPT